MNLSGIITGKTNKGVSFDDFRKTLIEHSKSDSFSIAINEWHLHDYSHDPTNSTNCICNKQIYYRFVIKNEITEHLLMIGSVCISNNKIPDCKFKKEIEDSKKIYMRETNKIKKYIDDPEKLNDFFVQFKNHHYYEISTLFEKETKKNKKFIDKIKKKYFNSGKDNGKSYYFVMVNKPTKFKYMVETLNYDNTLFKDIYKFIDA